MCSVRKVHRTARIALRTTGAQRRRCYGLLRNAGDVWAWVINCNWKLREWHCPEVANAPGLCRELTGTSFGELSPVTHAASKIRVLMAQQEASESSGQILNWRARVLQTARRD